MQEHADPTTTARQGAVAKSLRRAFAEFLSLPTTVVALLLLLAAAMIWLDTAEVSWLLVLRDSLSDLIFGSSQATSGLLGTLAAGLVTLTSITFSVVLLAVQQAASSMTHQVIDQFLRRKLNQLFFGFYVGLSLYSLIVLATVQPSFNPVLAATVALLLSIVALYGLIFLIYNTIVQIRPASIVHTIHGLALAARTRQLDLVLRTRRAPRHQVSAGVAVTATESGFLVGIDLDALTTAAGEDGRVEIVLGVSIGSFISFGDVIAHVSAQIGGAGHDLDGAVRRALLVDRARDVDVDPAYCIRQLVDIGWTSISTSKQSPAPGMLAILTLRDLLARWSTEKTTNTQAPEPGPVVYHDDVPEELMAALEALAVVSSESMQAQNYAEVVRAIAVVFDRLDPQQQRRAEDLILRVLSGLGDHVLTTELDTVLTKLTGVLTAAGRSDTAAAAQQARDTFAGSIGKLNSRGTRVPSSES